MTTLGDFRVLKLNQVTCRDTCCRGEFYRTHHRAKFCKTDSSGSSSFLSLSSSWLMCPVQQHIDRPKSVTAMDDVWMWKQKKQAETDAEMMHHVPAGWKENDEEGWEIPREKQYDGALVGGGLYGPATSDVVKSTTLVKLFWFYFSWDLLGCIAQETNQYATEDRVKPVSGHGIEDELEDEAATKKKRRKSVLCGCWCHDHTKGVCHCYNPQTWTTIVTPGAILVFLVNLMFRGAHGA